MNSINSFQPCRQEKLGRGRHLFSEILYSFEKEIQNEEAKASREAGMERRKQRKEREIAIAQAAADAKTFFHYCLVSQSIT